MDNLTDQLLSHVFRNLTDLADLRNCRLISQKWKRCVMEACRDKFHVVFPLTDSTFHSGSQLTNTPVSFHIYSFTGKENNDAWATSGIEPLLQTTEWLQFTGSKVNTEEIPRILGLAHDSLKTLSFKCLQNDLTSPFIEMLEPFTTLRKLSIGYYSNGSPNDTFGTFTKSLEKWNCLDCGVQLPLLESLNLYFDSRCTSQHITPIKIGSEGLFRNYLAISKLLLKYKKTLREVKIERVLTPFNSSLPNHEKREWLEMEGGLEALDELNLDILQLSHKQVISTTRDIEIEVLGRPKNLKNILFNTFVRPRPTFSWGPLVATLSSFNNANSNYLTSLKISLVLWSSTDRTMAINLGGLRDCLNLRTLCLKITSSEFFSQLPVRNVDLLPRGISVLHFESVDVPRSFTTLLNQQQIRWIIDNLNELESFRMSLTFPGPLPNKEDYNNEQVEDDDDDDEDNSEDEEDAEDDAQIQQEQQHEEENRLVNINLDTFDDLLAMPNLKHYKVCMMSAEVLSTARLGQVITGRMWIR